MSEHVASGQLTSQAARTRHDAAPGHQVDDAQRARVGGPIIQTKMSVGAAGDSYEREADAVAAKVVRALQSPGPVGADDGAEESGRVRRAVGTQAASGQPVESATRVQRIQRAGRIGAEGGDIDSGTERILRSSMGGGRPMSDEARSKMEPAFGADFSGIRVHAGSRATELNDRIQAKAFTTGSDIFFRDGLPDTSTTSGQSLLAHELTHTVQQGAAGVQRQANEVAGSVATRIQRGGGDESVGLLSGLSEDDSEIDGWDGHSTTTVYAKSKGVHRGQRNLYTHDGKHAGNIAKGAMLDIEVPHYEADGVLGVHAPPPTSTTKGNKPLVKLCSSSKSITLLEGADPTDIWISYNGIEIQDDAQFGFIAPAKDDDADGEAEPEESQVGVAGDALTISAKDETVTHGESGAVLSQDSLVVPLGAGNKLTLKAGEQAVKGSFKEKLSYKTGVHPSFDMPIPAPIPAYATVGFDADLKLGLEAKGTYKIVNNAETQTFDIDGTVGGKITGSLGVHAGLGVGLANIAGVEANLLAKVAADYETKGKLKGEVTRVKSNEFHSSTLSLSLESKALLEANLGGQLKAKLVGMQKSKTIKLGGFTFAEFDYNRLVKVEKAGLSKGEVVPRLGDFRKAFDDTDQLFEPESDKTPLLGESKAAHKKAHDDALRGINMYSTELKKFNGILTAGLAAHEDATITRTKPRLAALRSEAEKVYESYRVLSELDLPKTLDVQAFEAKINTSVPAKNEKKFLLDLYTNYYEHGR
jgi:hypothetical protein